MPYPTTAELVAASTNAQLAALTAPQQDALRAAAIAAVEGYANQSFDVEGSEEAPVAKLLAGTGARELYLPSRLEALIDLSVPNGSVTFSDVQVAEDRNRIFIERVGFSTWVERALRESTELVFPRGGDMVTVTGVWGWENCPEAIAQAVRFDMEDAASADSSELAPSLRAWSKLGMDSIGQGPLNVQIAKRPNVLSPRAADLIDVSGLVWQNIGEVL